MHSSARAGGARRRPRPRHCVGSAVAPDGDAARAGSGRPQTAGMMWLVRLFSLSWAGVRSVLLPQRFPDCRDPARFQRHPVIPAPVLPAAVLSHLSALLGRPHPVLRHSVSGRPPGPRRIDADLRRAPAEPLDGEPPHVRRRAARRHVVAGGGGTVLPGVSRAGAAAAALRLDRAADPGVRRRAAGPLRRQRSASHELDGRIRSDHLPGRRAGDGSVAGHRRPQRLSHHLGVAGGARTVHPEHCRRGVT